tara:strand:+ start:1334 stop:1828 length:495 start_codon:yes stop_codon:yes gene_type:complete
MSLTLEVDFTGIEEGRSMGYPPSGLHTGVISDITHYEDSNSLYIYIDTDGVTHREKFGLAYDGGKKALLRFMNTFSKNSLAGQKKEIPFHKLKGKTVYFNYTAPTLDESGRPVDGSYPRYSWYPKDKWQSMKGVMSEKPTTQEASPPSVDNGGGDFDFLLEDSD